MECKICIESYDQSEKRPRVLPCGHTFCSSCINNIFTQDYIKCPSCRIKHIASTASCFPVSFDFEELIQAMKPDKPGMNRIMAKMKEDQILSLINASFDCKEMLSQLECNIDSLDDVLAVHDVIIEIHRKAKIKLKTQRDNVQNLKRKGIDEIDNLQSMLKILEIASSAHEVDNAIDIADKECEEVKKWVEECTNLFSEKIVNSNNVQEDTMKELEKLDQIINATVQPRYKCKEDTPAVMRNPTMTTNALLKMDTPGVKHLVESNQIVAVQNNEGRSRYAKISLGDDNTICLHHLKDEPPSTQFYSIPYGELMNHVNASSALTFLDVSWPRTSPRRVYIRLDPNGKHALGRQFLLMCTAELGPTHADTKFSDIWYRGRKGEEIRGGNYDDEGGKAIVEGLSTEWSQAPLKDGLVGGVSGTDTRFSIITKGHEGYSSLYFYFGMVEKGLDVVREAVEANKNIKRVKVEECGVVLELQ